MSVAGCRVNRLSAGDLPRAISTIVRAFAWHEPWGEWALPDPGSREERLRRLVEADIRDRFLPRGECWTIDGGACVSLWMPPPSRAGAAAFASRRDDDAYSAYGDRAEAMREGDELITSMKPREEHWYLDTLATDPELMREGLGGALLDHNLAIRDSRGEACALDTHTDENVGFYERRGFEVLGEATLPGNGPRLFMMFRPPRG
jgi:ribosomal protein S18 acetylase RimI-like enzyme